MVDTYRKKGITVGCVGGSSGRTQAHSVLTSCRQCHKETVTLTTCVSSQGTGEKDLLLVPWSGSGRRAATKRIAHDAIVRPGTLDHNEAQDGQKTSFMVVVAKAFEKIYRALYDGKADYESFRCGTSKSSIRTTKR